MAAPQIGTHTFSVLQGLMLKEQSEMPARSLELARRTVTDECEHYVRGPFGETAEVFFCANGPKVSTPSAPVHSVTGGGSIPNVDRNRR